MRVPVLFTLRRKLRTNMLRMQFLGYSLHCAGTPAGCVSGGSSFVIFSIFFPVPKGVYIQH